MFRSTSQFALACTLLLALLCQGTPEAGAQGKGKMPVPAEVQRLYRQIEVAWKTRRAAQIGGHLAPKVDLVLPGYRGRYGKAQATQILIRLFTEIRVQQFKIVQMNPTYARASHEYILRGTRHRRSLFIRIVRLDRRWLIDRIEEF